MNTSITSDVRHRQKIERRVSGKQSCVLATDFVTPRARMVTGTSPMVPVKGDGSGGGKRSKESHKHDVYFSGVSLKFPTLVHVAAAR